MYYNKKFVLNIFIFGVIICKVIPTPVENSTDFLRSSDVANDTDSEEINQRSTPKGNYSFRKQAAFHKGIFPTSSPIYINQTGEEHTDAEAIHVSSPMTAHNHPPNKIEIVTRHYRKSSTQYVDRANRGKIGSPQESKLQGEHSASTDIMNTGAQVTESDSNIVTKLMEAQSSFSNFREDAIKPTDFSTDGLASSTNSTNGTITRILPDQHEESQGNSNSTDTPRLEHDVLATGTEEYIPIHKYRHVKNHTIEYIPLHKYRNTKNRHHLHHLNLVPIEDGPFGTLIWKDKKYLISVLIPIAIGVIGAGCIIGMAYIVRFCHKNERRIHEIKQSLQEGQQSRNDQVILLNDSDEDI